jgi:hypothetical protein
MGSVARDHLHEGKDIVFLRTVNVLAMIDILVCVVHYFTVSLHKELWRHNL